MFPEKEIDILSDIVVSEMQNAVKLDVPLTVDVGVRVRKLA